jgi:cell division protease FtsH
MSDKGKRPGRGGVPTPQVPRPMRTMSFWFLMVILLFIAIQLINYGKPQEHEIQYSRFMSELEANNLREVEFLGPKARGRFREAISIPVHNETIESDRFWVKTGEPSFDLLELMRAQSTEMHPIEITVGEAPINWWGTLTFWAPVLLLVLLWFFFIRQMQGGSNRAFSFGKSRAKLVGGDKPRTTFEDVAGAEEAKVELNEIVEFLSDPKKFKRMGARIPRGALLIGPPGTGKTLLAKAVAGEARVPFYSMSGSDFVEMFVGVGASRVRDLFEQGKKNAPCIIFVDELDAVGRHRGAGLGGGHDEREQTLNQLLVEMDGFDTSEGVILLAATNRPDVLDPALLRPGRFDRQIMVDMPDVRGREGILRVHMRNVPLAEDVDVKVLAQGSPGLSGADLANLVNEAALLAARLNHDKVYMIDFDEARDKIMIGPERRSVISSEEKRNVTAFHEAGHAIVGAHFKDSDSLYKVTIVARGMAEGVTHYLPKDEAMQLWDREYFIQKIITALGGRVAEEITFDRITAGAAQDIKAITGYARRMVTEWGMSEDLGPIAYGENQETVFLGRSMASQQNFSERTAQLIDEEVRKIVDHCHERCRAILGEHAQALKDLAATLLERETLTGEDVEKIMNGEELAPFDKEAAEAARKRKVEETLSRVDRIDEVLDEAGRKTEAEEEAGSQLDLLDPAEGQDENEQEQAEDEPKP